MVDETWLVEKKKKERSARRTNKTFHRGNKQRAHLSNTDLLRLEPRSVSFMPVLIRGCNLRPWRIYLAHISRHPSRYPCVSCRREWHDKTEIDGSGLEMFAGPLAIRKSIRRRRGWLVGENANGPRSHNRCLAACARASRISRLTSEAGCTYDLLQTDLWNVWRFDRREYSVNYDSLLSERTSGN